MAPDRAPAAGAAVTDSDDRSDSPLVPIAARLSAAVDALHFAPPVHYVYNPLDYAWLPYAEYLRRYGGARKTILLVGMNPGPFGMVQTGVPFGDVAQVRDWLGIEAPVARPRTEHPKRPVLGFGCTRREVSGTRLWSWARERYAEPEAFFRKFFVWNYCPLAFMEDSGRNRTPDKLAVSEREALFAVCDRALGSVVEALRPRRVIGIGRFAYRRCHAALEDGSVPIGVAPHPSPASPSANKGWVPLLEQALSAQGIELP